MISVILLVVALLILPSCQPVPEPPERQPEIINVAELGLEPGAAPAKPETPAEPEIKKTARQYVREGYRLLLAGKESEAQRALQSALRQAPKHKQAAMLLQQIEADPVTHFGSESFNYRIQPNDTLTGIDKQFLGDPPPVLPVGQIQ